MIDWKAKGKELVTLLEDSVRIIPELGDILMETMYRIYCEDVDRSRMEAILRMSLDNFTITPATGFYKGVREKSVVIDVFETTKEKINFVCQELAQNFHQELVAYVEMPCSLNGATGTMSIFPLVATVVQEIRA